MIRYVLRATKLLLLVAIAARLADCRPINVSRERAVSDTSSSSIPPTPAVTATEDDFVELSTTTDQALSRTDESIPMIVFEAQNRSCIECTEEAAPADTVDFQVTLIDDDDDVDDVVQEAEEAGAEHTITEATGAREPISSNEANQIKLKSTNGDSDTIFFISNTEVKLVDSSKAMSSAAAAPHPTTYENFVIELTDNLTTAASSTVEPVKLSETQPVDETGPYPEDEPDFAIQTIDIRPEYSNSLLKNNFSVPLDVLDANKTYDLARANSTLLDKEQEGASNFTSLTVIDSEAENS